MDRGWREQDGRNGNSKVLPPCPVCGTRLTLSFLDIDDEDAGTTDLLLLLDCPTGDYHATFTKDDITKVLAAEVVRRLR